MAATFFKEAIEIIPKDFPEAMKLLSTGDPRMRTIIKNVLVDVVKYTDKEIRRLVLERYDISPASLNDQTHRAKFKTKVVLPTREELDQGRVEIHATRFPVMRFNVIPQSVPNQKGIPVADRQTVSIITVRGGGEVGARNRFLAKMQSGHIGVFMRKPDATHRIRPDGQRTQLNISEEHMVSVAEMVRSNAIQPVLRKQIEDRVEHRINVAFASRYWLRDAF